MIQGKKVIVVLPAYKAEKTLERTVKAVPPGVVDEFILVDDSSPDNTAEVAKRLGLTTIVHEKNLGYGGNQKSCYRLALEHGTEGLKVGERRAISSQLGVHQREDAVMVESGWNPSR